MDRLVGSADNDGVVCLPPLNREQPAAARLDAAQALRKQLAQILEGEAAFDLFTRWNDVHFNLARKRATH